MKIAWIEGRNLNTDLSKTTQFSLIENLIKLGNEVEYFVPKSRIKERKYIKFIPTINKNILGYITFYLMLFFYIPLIVYQDEPDVIILNYGSFFSSIHMIFLSKIKIIKTKFILYIVSIPVETEGLYGLLNKLQYFLSMSFSKFFLKDIIFLTEKTAKEECKKFKINREETKIGICHCGVDQHLFNKKGYKKQIKEMKKRFGLDTKFIIMYHGVLSKTRGLQETIKSMSKIKNKYPQIVLFILGYGEYKKELEQLIEKKKIKDNVIIWGPVDNNQVPAYIAMSDVGIIPLPNNLWWRYQSPLKLFENLAMEKPVILTDIPAHREVINNKNYEFFISSNNPDKIAEAIIKVYNRKERLNNIGINGRKIILKEYTWERIAMKLEDFLKESYKTK